MGIDVCGASNNNVKVDISQVVWKLKSGAELITLTVIVWRAESLPEPIAILVAMQGAAWKHLII